MLSRREFLGQAPGATVGVEETSTVAQSHTHALCVPRSDLTPSHTVSLSAAQLVAIRSGSTVTVESSNVVDPVNGALHLHRFTNRRGEVHQPAPTTTSTSPPPGRGGC